MRSARPTAAMVFFVVFLTFLGVPREICSAQNPKPAESTPASKPSGKPAPALQLTKQQKEGLRLLQAGEAEAAGLDPEMHAFILWRLSHAYVSLDRKKSEQLENAAFQTTRAIEPSTKISKCSANQDEDRGNMQEFLQQRILDEMIKNGRSKRAEDLLPNAEPSVGAHISSKLIVEYTTKKNFQHAEQLLRGFAGSKDYPYDAATTLLAALPPEQSGDRLIVFNEALTNFEQNGTIPGSRTADFATLIEQIWRQLPPPLVLEAIDKVLEEAKDQPDKLITATFNNQLLTMNSSYELRLFQLLPILQELDKSRADTLLQEAAELKPKLQRYPQGQASLASEGGHVYITDDESAPEVVQVAGEVDDQSRERIEKEFETDPDRALADALRLPLGSEDSISPRLVAIWWIAAANTKSNPRVSRMALDEIAKLDEQMGASQVWVFSGLAEIYLQLGDKNAAAKSIRASLKIAQKVYAWDTDSDDPNQAFKAMWPSTILWQNLLGTADKISPDLAEEVLNDIPDPEITAVVKVQRGGILLGKALHLEGAICHKNSSPMFFQ